ncbi:MAG TPA: MBL fold metallo-hydrolase, partial [Gammaproteobacteria bacterium]|nr:MBL fold metallo-hydrolase [Gammaproteobacteria bacterium]
MICHLKEHEFVYGKLESVAPGIRRLTARNPSAFTFHGTGTYVIGQGQVAVIDPGPLDADHIQALVEGLSAETVTHILVTHCHLDHSPAARELKSYTGALTYGFGPHGEMTKGVAEPVEEGADLDFVPDVRCAHGDVINGLGW